MTGNSITGRKENIAYDFYETPKWATEKAVKAMLRDKILNKKEFVYGKSKLFCHHCTQCKGYVPGRFHHLFTKENQSE